MALEGATKSIPFVKGPDMKTDPKLVDDPAALTNAVFRSGSIAKRYGRASLSSDISGGGAQTTGEAIFPFGDSLIRINSGTTYGLPVVTNQWRALPGGNNYCTVAKQQLIRNLSFQAPFDRAVVGGVAVLAWCEVAGTSQGAHIAVYDLASGVFYQTGLGACTGSTTSMTVPRCVVIGTKVVVLFADFAGTALYSAVVDAASPTTAPSLVSIRSDLYGSGNTFDAIEYSGVGAVVAYPTSATDLNVFFVTSTGAVATSPAITAVAGIATTLNRGLLIQKDTTGRIYIVFGDGGTSGTSYLVRSSTLTSVLGATPIVATGAWSGSVADFTHGASYEATSNLITVVLSRTLSAATPQFLGTAVLGPAGVTSAWAEISATCQLVVQTDIANWASTPVFGVVNYSVTDTAQNLQSTAWMLTLGGVVCARALLNAAANTNTFNSSQFHRVARSYASGQTVSMPFGELGRTEFVSGFTGILQSITPTGITSNSATAVSAGTLPTLQVGPTTYLGGGLPRSFDGTYVVDAGIALAPIISSITMGAGGALSAGSYQYRVVATWLNAKGELIRSPVSLATTVTATATQKATIKIAPMPLCMRDRLGTSAVVQFEIYRTTANGTVFYRVNGSGIVFVPVVNAATYAATTAGYVQFVDSAVTDTVLQANELLYTTGGILDWDAPESFAKAFAVKNRLVTLSQEDPYAWTPSAEWSPGENLRFSSTNTNRVPADTGPLVGGASMDGRLVLFTTSAAYITSGDGPDLLGNNNYPPAERVAAVDAGPVPGSAAAIIETPQGIMFQGPSGITLLGRDLNLQFIGSDVATYSTGIWVVRSAVLDVNNQEVRFQADPGRDVAGAQMGTLVPSIGGVCLVYNYYYQQWSTFPGYGAQSACLYQGAYTMVRSDGVVRQERAGTFRDDGAYYSSSTETPWIKTSGLQGFQRLWYAAVLGTYGSDFTLTWEVALDYSGTGPSVPTWSESVSLDGAGQFGLGGPFQVRHHIGHKCEAIKFRFTDSNIRGSGEGMALTDLTLEYAGKKGAYRLPAARTL